MRTAKDTPAIWWLALALCLGLWVHPFVDGFNILQMGGGISPSHMMFNYRIVETLADRGHNVTLALLNKLDKVALNLRNSSKVVHYIEQPLRHDMRSEGAIFQKMIFQKFHARFLIRVVSMMLRLFRQRCSAALVDRELVNRIAQGSYDVIIGEGFEFCPYALQSVANSRKFIVVSPGMFTFSFVAHAAGISGNPSYIPESKTTYSDRMRFLHRTANFLVYSLSQIAFHFLYMGPQCKTIRQALSYKGKSCWTLTNGTTAVMLNGDGPLDFPRPLVPEMNYMSDLEIKSETTLDKSDDGWACDQTAELESVCMTNKNKLTMKTICTVVLVVFWSVSYGVGLNVFQIGYGISNSHVLFNHRIAETLLARDHQVTLLFVGRLPSQIRPLKSEAFVEINSLMSPKGIHMIKDLQKMAFKDFDYSQFFTTQRGATKFLEEQCEGLLLNEKLRSVLQRGNFHVVVSHVFDFCPYALYSMLPQPAKFLGFHAGVYVFSQVAESFGLSDNPSVVPNIISSHADTMTFYQRLKNTLANVVGRAFLTFLFYPKQKQTFKSVFGANFSHVWQLRYEGHGLLLNGEWILDFPRPIVHEMAYISDLQPGSFSSLSQEWQALMDNAVDGVILFSFGSVANTTYMPRKMKIQFAEAFRLLPTYTIIWKLDDQLPTDFENVTNIKVHRWLPQRAILRHPKLKLFITHGGYNSFLEASLSAVPMLLIPLFGDQYTNSQRAARLGLAHVLDKTSLSTQVIFDSINSMVHDEKIVRNLKRISRILHDRILPARDEFVHRVEKIVRHKHRPIMAVAKRLWLFQYLSLDTLFIFAFHVLMFAKMMW